jgi:diguanylate cyclase (GGDEF)-like protein/PAS domain S-box-containing protein
MHDHEPIHILLVDDRPENLLALEAIIESDDCRPIKASSGEEALAHLLKYDFAVILLDVQMPGIDGFGTAKIIKAREKTKDIPIIFVTANYMDTDHIGQGYSLGAVDYILKPFDPMMLKAKVRNFINLYKLNQRLVQQADDLLEKTKELEKANLELYDLTLELRKSEALANVISETSIDSMFILDEKGTILKVNPAVEFMFHYDEQELLHKNIRILFSHSQSYNYIDSLLNAIHGISTNNLKDMYAERKDGGLIPVEVQVGKRYVQDKFMIACTIRDMTNQKRTQELISHMAYHDGLTNLPNRRRFNDFLQTQLDEAKATDKPFALLYLDMDRFKYVNDSLGHHIGDRLLQEISGRLLHAVRSQDFVSRLGGDEFVVVLLETNREQAISIAESLIERFRLPFHIDRYELIVTTSIGLSVFPFDGEDKLVLLKHADAALYRAKEHGKNNLKIYHSGMNLNSYRAYVLQNDLRKAMLRDELSMHYQPRVDTATGKIKSAEALLRWKHPNWGYIPPNEFIPIAEEMGLIIEIGEWALRRVCEQLQTWQALGIPLVQVAVNFSAQQFLQKDLMDTIVRCLRESNISPEWLEIEITETTLLQDGEGMTQLLKQIRNMGITVSIDDFGLGYSSLNYLRKYPMDKLKIDKSFIQEISSKQPRAIALVSSIISLAQSLNMSVIAEGVETDEQLQALKQKDCELIQGFLYSPPVPPDQFEVMLRNGLNKGSHSSPKNKPASSPVVTTQPLDKKVMSPLNSPNENSNQEILNLALYRVKHKCSISSREVEVFQLMIDGLSNKEISDRLFISEHTVKNHITHIFQKLNVADRLQAMSLIYQACMEESQKMRAQ